MRLDALLVHRGLVESRERARALILAGKVDVVGLGAVKAGAQVALDAEIRVAEPEHPWVSRGGVKLAHALDAFHIDVRGRLGLDIGASTGGFTDVLLARGAAEVVAVDVGYGQLVWRLQSDERVRVHDRTNVRSLEPETIGGPVALTVADLSFISLRTVLPALVACTAPDGELLPMVKPQFEVGKERLGAGGVVRGAELRVAALVEVAAAARALGLVVRGAVASPLPGPSGNVEYFLRLARSGADAGDDVLTIAVEEGP
jgi:23S rRNA (cytidine1920-2'-O)/16S rRNA (cytidine1409-2'-O)-methyltransferase